MTLHVHMQASNGTRQVFHVLSESPREAIASAVRLVKREHPHEGFRPLYVTTVQGVVL